VVAVSDEKPLGSARQRLRRERYAARQAAKAPVAPIEPPAASAIEAMRASRTAYEQKLAAARALFEQIVGQSRTGDLDRLIVALQLFARSLERRL
jgi:hypothetical protein